MENTRARNLDELASMHPCEFEEWRERGETERQAMTSAVLSLLTVPECWTVNGEFRAEFGGLFPVQLRFAPPGEEFCLCVCSPGEIAGEWIVLFASADGGYVRDVLRLTPFEPSRISALISAAAQACLLKYSMSGLADYLLQEADL
ncbi:conjugation system SOS inhibitor PsiB [Pantoea dispersa]|uniref:conjugation system SOS inhibitor PsiB n=1 Tax=Pantoea dispersa TaxID=59814 RepID=UPI0021AE89A6|nr:conjugation system SOS inhibitor PsiB [Pantoea dispersa]MCT6592790.1 conjugation system SOS inhibitor PsiB [Pantoea dispersa]MCW0323808.1 Protein PsiB [Pantoea dispersa]MCW0328544.1 Protein PsiB [Pantoea dispersa]MCW0434971.1 Protein PsiB [Pantoea dispersa]